MQLWINIESLSMILFHFIQALNAIALLNMDVRVLAMSKIALFTNSFTKWRHLVVRWWTFLPGLALAQE